LHDVVVKKVHVRYPDEFLVVFVQALMITTMHRLQWQVRQSGPEKIAQSLM